MAQNTPFAEALKGLERGSFHSHLLKRYFPGRFWKTRDINAAGGVPTSYDWNYNLYK